ncbi:MAG TPA: SGNH/GDSL hydrolase family protein [Blastocatellia bacterium]|jgi:lysophospholipase L1-like esterase|nr:SGNH/GDSL hydrolase family protein [Blastocatellia bacterium]
MALNDRAANRPAQQEIKAQPRRRRWWFTPLLVAVTLAICFGVAEGAIRIFWSSDYPKQPVRWQFDPELGLVHSPGSYNLPFRRCIDGRDCQDVLVKFTINRQGFRSSNDYEEEPGRPLIAVLGDSMIEAAQVDDDKTTCSVLESQLRDKFPRVEVRNAGMNSSGFVHYYARWQKLIADMHPDVLVIAALGINDFRNCSPHLENFVAMKPHYRFESGTREVWFEPVTSPHSRMRRFSASLYEGLELTRFLKWLSAASQQTNASAGVSGIAADAYIYEEPASEHYKEAAELGREYLQRLILEAKAKGTRVVVVYLTWAGEAIDSQWNQMNAEYEAGSQAGRLVRTRPEQIVREAAVGAGAEFVSFLEVAQRLTPEDRRSLWHSRVDNHLTERGNQLLGDTMAGAITTTLKGSDAGKQAARAGLNQ